MQPFPEQVDLVLYINLNTRTDRRQEMETELQRLDISSSKILRWEATRNAKHGALGCTMSHIAALEYILTLPESIQSILIMEDDFNFVDDKDLVKNSIARFLTYPRELWDICLLSYYVCRRLDYDSLVSMTLAAMHTSGFLVNRSAIPRILPIFREARDGIIKTSKGMYCIDVYWWNLMKNRKCFYFNKYLGYQRKSYSNITSRIAEPTTSEVNIVTDRELEQFKERKSNEFS